MYRTTHLAATCVAVLMWALTLVLVLAPGAQGAAPAPCEQRVIEDWSADGRIDRVYKLQCYEDAIAALPLELRDYSDLVDVIRRSQSDAVIDPDARPRGLAAAAPVVNTSASRTIPPALLLLGGVGLTLFAIGGLSLLLGRLAAGRRRATR